ncbi:hypothetical protein PMAYCL1PPCAC_06519, partial [Pristionchus mayeri]
GNLQYATPLIHLHSRPSLLLRWEISAWDKQEKDVREGPLHALHQLQSTLLDHEQQGQSEEVRSAPTVSGNGCGMTK